jgi:hypothetical protein
MQRHRLIKLAIASGLSEQYTGPFSPPVGVETGIAPPAASQYTRQQLRGGKGPRYGSTVVRQPTSTDMRTTDEVNVPQALPRW